MDRIIIIGVAAATGGLVVVAPWEMAVGLASLSVMLGGRSIPVRWVLFALMVVLGGAIRAERAIAEHEAKREHAKIELPVSARCSAVGHVTASPVSTRGAMRWEAELVNVDCGDGGALWRGRVVLYGGPDDLVQGDVVELIAQLAMLQRFSNGPGTDARPAEARRGLLRSGSVVSVERIVRGQGIFAAIDWSRNYVRRRIQATFPADTAAMARALVLGENDLAPQDDAVFCASGLAHLLAVSGMHLVIVVAGAVKVIRALLIRIDPLGARCDVGRVASLVGLPFAWFYAVFAGGSGSATRAAWMLSAGFGCRALGRRGDAPRALGISALAMAVLDPLVAFDRSFTLSILATAGLMFGSKPVELFFGAHFPAWVPRCLVRSVAASLAATVPCSPLLACFSPTLPLGGLVANVLAVPLGEMAALPLCLAHTVLSPWPAVERGCALLASGALWLVRAVARTFASVPLMAPLVPVPTAWQLVTIVAGVAGLAGMKGKTRTATLVLSLSLLGATEWIARRNGRPVGALRITCLDVGQGDAALVDLPDGSALLIDGGGLVGSPMDVGRRVIAPVLRTRRRSHLRAVIVSHPHPDHYLGLISGLDGVSVDEWWDTGQGEREGERSIHHDLLQAVRLTGTPILTPSTLCGVQMIGGASIDVLAPCPDPSPDREANDNSFVLRLTFGRRSMLFVGDAEQEEERILMAGAASRLHADVLKVGHHGSRTSTSRDFLDTVSPREAIVSVGIRNRFGHPHPATLAALRQRDIRVWRTDEHGSITVWTDGEHLTVGPALTVSPPRLSPAATERSRANVERR